MDKTIKALIEARKNIGKFITVSGDGLDTTAIRYNGIGDFTFWYGSHDTDGQGFYQKEYQTTQSEILGF